MIRRRCILVVVTGVLCSVSGLYSQVGINTEAPYQGTELHVKNKTAVSGDTIPKGIMIPRMREAQRNLIDVSNATDVNSLMIYNIDEDCYNYYSKSEGEWKSLCGTPGKAVFTIDYIDCDALNADGVHGDYGNGVSLDNTHYIVLTVNVTKVGSYSIIAKSTPNNGYHFERSGTFTETGKQEISIPASGKPINHTEGTDPLSAADDTDDSFSFVSSGGATSCTFKVHVRNTAARPKFSMNCATIVVHGYYFEDQQLSSVPQSVKGSPAESHELVVYLKNIDPSAAGAIGELKTNEVDGFYFYWRGVITPNALNEQEVHLQGVGTPYGLNDKSFIVASNSETDRTSCPVTVRMLIPPKRLMALGQWLPGYTTENTYSYNPTTVGSTYPTNGFNVLLTDKENFGYHQWAILRFAGFDNAAGTDWYRNYIPTLTSGISLTTDDPGYWTDDDRDMVGITIDGWRNFQPATLESYLKGLGGHRKVDIFMIAYTGDALATARSEWFRTGNADDTQRCQKLVDFVHEGGILMICSEHTVSNGNFLNLLFGNPSPAIGSADGAGAGSGYAFGFDASTNTSTEMKPYYAQDNDPILVGPFENILGRYWCEDASTTKYVTNLPVEEIVIYSGAKPSAGKTSTASATVNGYPDDGVTVFRHRELPFIFIGDGGFNSARSRVNTTDDNLCPFVLTSRTINGHTYPNFPNYRIGMGPGTGTTGTKAYNTAFTANAFAWCILQAEEYRRTHK